tara:strand:- start:18072 stop:19235 length:1164 start_codon:yes stop_codon:yes gene_type:complete
MANEKDGKEANVELKQVFEQFKQTHDAHDSEIQKLGSASSETKQEMERQQDAMDALETKLNAALAGGSADSKAGPDEAEETKAAFLRWVRKDEKGMTPEEVKLLTRSDDTTGGFLAPAEYVREITKGVTEVSPLRQVARVRTTSNHSVQIPTRTGQFAAQWVSEMGTRSETDGLRWGLEEISTFEMYGLVDITQQNLEDSAFNLEAELNDEFVLQFSVTEGSGFITGDAAGKPEGFLNNANIATVNSGAAGGVTADGLIDLFFALKTAYAQNATWMANRLVVRDIRKLKDTQDQYLWQPGLAGLAPSTILDRPYLEATDMPVAASASKSIAIGDWRRGYTIVDRVSMSMLRDPYTQATSGAVRFLARRRVGGMTVLPEAIKIQVLSV